MPRMRIAAIGAFVTLVAVSSPGWGALTRDEIRSANAASQAAIVTLQAHVEASIQFNPSLVPKTGNVLLTEKHVIEYARSGDKERFKELQGAWGVRDVIRDTRNRTGSEFRPKQGNQTIETGVISDGTRTFPLEIWQWTLFDMPDGDEPLVQLLDRGEVRSLQNKTDSGRALIYLDIHDPPTKRDPKGRRYEVWVDPGVNYLARKVICHRTLPNGRKARIEMEVQSFREVKAGVFFPERVVRSGFYRESWADKGEATLSNIRVNESLPAGFFRHTFPSGTRVTDAIRGITYTVGLNGQPTKAAQFNANPSPSPEPRGTPTPLTADVERWPWHRLVLIGSLITVAAGLGVILWKRRNRAATV
jgi:hypothetical protein